MNEELNKEQQKELQKLIDAVSDEAKKVVEDYENNPSEISGSVVQIHEESPFVDERIPEDANWKRVLKGVSLDDGKKFVKELLDSGKSVLDVVSEVSKSRAEDTEQ